MNKCIFEVLYNKKSSEIPIWLMRQAGRYLPEYQKVRKSTKGFLDLCYNPDLASEVTLQPIRRFNLDAAIIFSDILVVPNSLGIKLDFLEDAGPILESVQTEQELVQALKYQDKNKLFPVYEAIAKTKSKLPNNVSLIGFCGAPWTLAAYIVEGKISKDLAKVKATYYNNRKFFTILIDLLIDNIAEHLINQIKAGAEIIQIFDSWAGMLINDDYEQLVIKPTQKIIKKIKEIYPEIKIICFPRLSGLQYKQFCQQVDCDVISIDQYMPISFFSDQKTIQGNLDPLVLLSKSKDLIKERVDIILKQVKNENYIFNLGHGIVPNTPPENVEFLVNYIKSYRKINE